MSILTTLPIKMSDVCLELYGSSSTLGKTQNQMFIDASGTFNPTYEGVKDRLTNFRGYEHLDSEAPSIPTLLIATNIAQTTFTLSWNASTDNIDVTGYKVFKNESLYQDVGNVITKDISAQTAGASADWTVSAYDVSSNESSQSSQLNVTQGVFVDPFFQTFSPQINAGLACGETADTTRYVTGGDEFPTNGETVYTNVEGTLKFNGGNDYFSDGDFSYQISPDGLISSRQICGA